VKTLTRWIGALVAVLFLSTATLHVFAHVGADPDAGCVLCLVQHAGAVSAPVPRIVSASVPSAVLAELPGPRVPSRRPVGAGARAPPASRA
jgi:hypothetical protein